MRNGVANLTPRHPHKPRGLVWPHSSLGRLPDDLGIGDITLGQIGQLMLAVTVQFTSSAVSASARTSISRTLLSSMTAFSEVSKIR